MKILVTGANGFLGRRVVDSLLRYGADTSEELSIRCLVRSQSAVEQLESLPVETVQGSLNERANIASWLEGVDVVVHLAASKSGSPMGMYVETVVSTELLLEAIAGSKVKKLVLCSSFSVYGATKLKVGEVFDENCPLESRPHWRDPYAWCKFYQEKVAKDKSGKLSVLTLRPGVIYGDDQGLLSPRVGMELPGLNVFLRIGSRAKLPLTHVENCGDAFALAALSENVLSGDFNVVDDDCPTQTDYFKLYQANFGKVRRKVYLPYIGFYAVSYGFELLNKMSNGNFPSVFSRYKTRSLYARYSYSNEKLKQEFGWSPRIDLRKGIERSKEFIEMNKML